MAGPVSLVPQRAYFAWMHLFLILFAVGSAFITASHQQSVSSVSSAGDSLRMPSGGGAVKRGDSISDVATRTAFGTTPPITHQQAHATDLEMHQVEASGGKVGSY